jgi:surface polysaccharide O-acyltransferase-like enzyme
MKKIVISLTVFLVLLSTFSICFAATNNRGQEAFSKIGEMFESGELAPTFMFLLAGIVLIIVLINKQSVEPKVANITIVVCIIVIFVDVFFYGNNIMSFLNEILSSEMTMLNGSF